jgi:hypothetical protein
MVGFHRNTAFYVDANIITQTGHKKSTKVENKNNARK